MIAIRDILTDNNNWKRYKLNHPDLNPYIISEIEKMLLCCNPKKGFFVGYCSHCKEDVIMHFKCNGKMCTRCGKAYVDKWARKAKKKVFPEMHRLVTLTIPADLRPILKGRWDLLKILQDSAHETIKIVACKTLRKEVKIGVLVGLQTYGDDLKFHPHLHCMVLEKARYENQFVNFNFIPKEMLRKTWRNVIVRNLCKANISYGEKILVFSMLEKYPNGFVTDVGERSMNKDAVIRYLARYMRHPAIANSRIEYYDGKIIKILLKSEKWSQFKKEFTIDEFITALTQHIPPKNFKVVRWYGLYSRREVRIEREKSKGRQETISIHLTAKKKIIHCPKCKNPLKDVMFFVNKPPDVKKSMRKISYWIDLRS
jgi:hypothetical protein